MGGERGRDREEERHQVGGKKEREMFGRQLEEKMLLQIFLARINLDLAFLIFYFDNREKYSVFVSGKKEGIGRIRDRLIISRRGG